MRIKLPWFISSRINIIQNSLAFYINHLRNLLHINKAKKDKIVFCCGFHGTTGAVEAIANVANLLSKTYAVEFFSFPNSHFNRKLSKNIKLSRTVSYDADLYICDLSCNLDVLKKLKKRKKTILMSVHGMLYSKFGLSAKQKLIAISYADFVQFVSYLQMNEYQLAPERCLVIPNMVSQVRKTTSTNNTGVVGNLNLKNKNVDASVNISLASEATSIHLWSVDKNKWNNNKVICHAWESNKEKIYNSFDVLVFMSEEETQGLGILESMSAGIPCLLSNIPAFEQFKTYKGIYIVDPTDLEVCKSTLNTLLKEKTTLKTQLINTWKKNYSEDAIAQNWHFAVKKIIESTRKLE